MHRYPRHMQWGVTNSVWPCWLSVIFESDLGSMLVFFQVTNEGLARKQVWNSIDRRILSIVLRGVSTNVTVRLNKARLIVKQCFVEKKTQTVRIPERGIPEKWDKITYRKLFLNKSVRKLKRLSGVRISEAQLYVHLFLTATKKLL